MSGLPYAKRLSAEKKRSGACAHVQFSMSQSSSLASKPMGDTLRETAARYASMHPDEHISMVRANMKRLETLSTQLWQETLAQRRSMPLHVRAVHEATSDSGIHIALYDHLLRESGYPEAARLSSQMKTGFPLIGDIPVCYKAKPLLVRDMTVSEHELLTRSHELFEQAVSKTLNNKQSSEMQQKVCDETLADVAKGRISKPERATLKDGEAAPTLRFPIQQQSAGGSFKTRIIDDFLRSEVNSLCRISGRIEMGRLDQLVSTCRMMTESQPQQETVLFKTDFQAAYKHCAVSEDHLKFANSIFLDTSSGEAMTCKHYAMPFGALGAVYSWDSLGDSMVWLFAHYLGLPLCRYVDDCFTVLYKEHSAEIRAHLLWFSNTLGIILDPSKTPEPSTEMTILGVLLKLQRYSRHKNLRVRISAEVDPSRATFWRETIMEILAKRSLPAQQASKLAGRLNFAVSAAVGGTGGSRLRNIYHQAFAGGAFSDDLARELLWWYDRLCIAKPALHSVGPAPQRTCTLYTDADGSGGIGAVLLTPNKKLFFMHKVDSSALRLRDRETQIIPLEVIAALVATYAFKNELGGCSLIAFIDNQSGLGALKKGRSHASDVHALVQDCLDSLENLHAKPQWLWVPSCLNVADYPSRGIDPALVFPHIFKQALRVDVSRHVRDLYVKHGRQRL